MSYTTHSRAPWLSTPRETVRYPKYGAIAGLDDHLLRDIGRTRGVGARDRRHRPDI